MTRALVVGYGSIGARHARLLAEEDCDVAVVSRRAGVHPKGYARLAEAVAQHAPAYVVVANQTAAHGDTLDALAALGFDGVVLVEKPLFGQARALPQHRFRALLVAYNLRFHPALQRLRALLDGEQVHAVQAYAGQYLPTWRPGRDYREVYSARRADGGGVLRDLSHELDYLNWLLGGWQRLTALGGHLSTLDIDADDTAVVLAAFERCPAVSLHLNYLDRIGRRALLVNTDRHTIEVNLTEGYLQVDGERTPVAAERDETYRRQHRAILTGDLRDVCSADEALAVVAMIEAAERSAAHPHWITR